MDSPDQRLRQARLGAGFPSAEAAAKRFHWKVAGYRHHENGTRDFDKQRAQDYAKAFGVSAAWLLCLPETQGGVSDRDLGDIAVIGDAAIGVWRESAVEKMPHAPEKKLAIPATAARRKGQQRFAVRVADTSVDRLFPVGWHVICVALGATEQTAEHFAVDDVVYIERTRRDMKETSLRRVSAIEADRMRLSTHSSDAKFKHDLSYPPTNSSTEKIVLLGKVVGQYGNFPS